MSDIRRVGDAGVHTVEGNLAGSRAARLTREREEQRLQYEAGKSKIKSENTLQDMASKFSSGCDVMDDDFRQRTTGLVSLQEFRKARDAVKGSGNGIGNEGLEGMKAEEERKQREEAEKIKSKQALAAANKRKKMEVLSFAGDDENGEEEEVVLVPKRRIKDPSIDTSFLPDKERDAALALERKRLEEEWVVEQERKKKEILSVTYSYWDGSGRRKVISIKTGSSIGAFLAACKQQLLVDLPELRVVSPESLMYVKEDMIIPHHITFYDLIVMRARGKSGPLFHFNVQEDLRLVSDIRIAREDSHAGKVVERRWYERNKHIYPASKWKVFDPLEAERELKKLEF